MPIYGDDLLTRAFMCHGFTDYRFLSFRPSEIAAAVVLSALAENQVIAFSSALAASEFPVNKVIILLSCGKPKLMLHCHCIVSEVWSHTYTGDDCQMLWTVGEEEREPQCKPCSAAEPDCRAGCGMLQLSERWHNTGIITIEQQQWQQRSGLYSGFEEKKAKHITNLIHRTYIITWHFFWPVHSDYQLIPKAHQSVIRVTSCGAMVIIVGIVLIRGIWAAISLVTASWTLKEERRVCALMGGGSLLPLTILSPLLYF